MILKFLKGLFEGFASVIDSLSKNAPQLAPILFQIIRSFRR